MDNHNLLSVAAISLVAGLVAAALAQHLIHQYAALPVGLAVTFMCLFLEFASRNNEEE